EGSQIAAALTGAGPRQQVLDLCAGAGGKTLAIAAAMQNTGQIYAYDTDRQQLRPIFERLKRAGARNVQVMNGGDSEALNELGPRFDVVLADAPCTGSGTWRRRPDSKWRIRPEALEQRIRDQDAVLSDAASLVKPGGRLVYVTCSLLPEENADRIEHFLSTNQGFALVPYAGVWRQTFAGEPPSSAVRDKWEGSTLQLTPAMHGTDGFFIAIIQRVDEI
ncbi:MAG: RsmB/NOP family class I SAM-dependent RNA methyltransferase, partial [Hyphomicrobiaceae bacterium]